MTGSNIILIYHLIILMKISVLLIVKDYTVNVATNEGAKTDPRIGNHPLVLTAVK